MEPALSIKTLTSPALIKRGCVNVIGLETIRAKTGARWEKMRDSIYARLETMLSQKLGGTDFFIRLSEMAYVVVMPSSDGDDARLSCFRIAHELHRSLLGECALPDIALSHVAGADNETLELKAFSAPELLALAVRGGIEELYRDIARPPGAYRPSRALEILLAGGELPAFRYVPVWDAPHDAISAYRVETERATPRRMGADLTRDELKKELKVFLAALNHAAGTLTGSLKSGGRYLMVVPVPFEILGAPVGRMDIAAACRNLAATLRPFLIFEIFGVPSGVPQSRMSDLVCALRPFCRAVTIELPPGELDHLAYQNAGHQGIGLCVPAHVPSGFRDEIVKLAAAAKRLGQTAFVNGLDTVELADGARRAGIQHLSGPFIGPSVDVPRGMRRQIWSDLVLMHAARSGTIRARSAAS